jgi:hypothetical protein
MLLGCFPPGWLPSWDDTKPRLNEAPLEDTGMSADRCAAMARAAELPYTAFVILNSDW